jgi:hypothetical protein
MTFAALGLFGLVLSISLVYAFVQDNPPINPNLPEIDPKSFSDMQSPEALDSIPSTRKGYRRDRRFWLAVLGGFSMPSVPSGYSTGYLLTLIALKALTSSNWVGHWHSFFQQELSELP